MQCSHTCGNCELSCGLKWPTERSIAEYPAGSLEGGVVSRGVYKNTIFYFLFIYLKLTKQNLEIVTIIL